MDGVLTWTSLWRKQNNTQQLFGFVRLREMPSIEGLMSPAVAMNAEYFII